ncbi:MAG: reverse transcriptase domain-containing protein [Sporomusa sp.]
MNQTRLLEKLEGFRKRNSNNPNFINKDLYRLLYDENIYITAYNAIKSNRGAETKGSDGTSLDGFCMKWVHEIISDLRNESYRPLPNKTQLIPKKNGKMRKLGFPNGKDKLLQEAVRIILEYIYEPTFSDYSHGFRPNRSTQTAMAQIENWHGTTWFIEGDISACFDEIDHRILETILRERISDERFIRLINKMLRAGYFDMQHEFHRTETGAPQGSTCSPILANIYLDKLDRFMANTAERENTGRGRRKNSTYTSIQYQIQKLRNSEYSAERGEQIRKLVRLRKSQPSVDMLDPKFRRVRYVRYADDFLVGITASLQHSKSIRDKIKQFLQDTLHLRLNIDKTRITHAYNDKVFFLGYFIQRSNKASRNKGNIRISANVKGMIEKLFQNGLCNSNGFPNGITQFIPLPPEKIVNYGNQILRGLVNQAVGCTNFHQCARIQYIVQFSIAKTIARKYDISLKQVFAKYGPSILINYLNERNKERRIRLALYPNFKRRRKHFYTLLTASKTPFTPKYNPINPTKQPCALCGSTDDIRMFHRKSVNLIPRPAKPIIEHMIRINRRQIPLCKQCYLLN